MVPSRQIIVQSVPLAMSKLRSGAHFALRQVREEEVVVKKFAVVAICLTFLSTNAMGQDAKTVIANAQKALGDVVYVELPKVGDTVEKGGQAGVVESVKSASEIYSPVAGEIVEINEALANDPAQVNSDPEGAAWFYKIKIANDDDLAALKDAAAYKAFTDSL